MVESDKHRFRVLVQMLGANYRAEVTTPLLQAYWMGLGDLSYEKFSDAVAKAIRKDDYMPPVARLRELAGHGKDVRPYHMPYKGLPAAEVKRIQASWEEGHRLTGGPDPTPIGELVGTFMAAAHAPQDEFSEEPLPKQGGRP